MRTEVMKVAVETRNMKMRVSHHSRVSLNKLTFICCLWTVKYPGNVEGDVEYETSENPPGTFNHV